MPTVPRKPRSRKMPKEIRNLLKKMIENMKAQRNLQMRLSAARTLTALRHKKY